MNRRQLATYVHFTAGILDLLLLIALTLTMPPSPSQILPALLFCGLIVFTDTFGVRLPSGMVSLLPMMSIAAYLVMGLVPAAWAAFVATLIYGGIRAQWARALELPPPGNRVHFLSLMAVNATMHVGSIIVGGTVFEALGGELPLEAVTADNLLPLVGLGLSYLVFNHLIASIVIVRLRRDEIKKYVKSLPHLLFYEGAPETFAPLVALIYTRLGVVQFILFALMMIVSSLVTRSLALTSRRLERRVKELDSLQAVGRVLSSSLNIDTILSAIHTQVAALMPARNFYVALYDAETDEVSFPLAFEDGQRVAWQSRRTSSGLTEQVLQTRRPLLIERDIDVALERMGLEQIGRTAASWLGVPILVGDEAIGIIAIQSYSTPEAYDLSHQEILVTIAGQAAVAIQNARLYERTDEALARRVQELASVLRTTAEGILLIDTDYQILAANRALANFLNVAQAEMLYHRLGTLDLEGDGGLLTRIGFQNLQALEQACEAVSAGDLHHRQIVAIPGPPERHLERTLTLVRDRHGATSGWLLVFRDVSEEIELTQLREDMMHMLVHDLRSPLTLLKGSLALMRSAIREKNLDKVQFLQEIAARGSERMLHLVDELLDISRLESDKLPIHPEPVRPEVLFREIAARMDPLVKQASVTLDVQTTQGLPDLYVDVELVERVLHNLVDNAIKFTPDGGIIQIWARPDPRNDRALLLGVTDTGPGIPPEEHPRLFEKFQQTSITGRRKGTGLGLPFCKLAVEAHGGEIWVESEGGMGTTFVIRLPAVS